MKCKELFDTVMQLIFETDSGADTDDYAEQFPYILATFCNDNAFYDSHYRVANSLPEQKNIAFMSLGLADDFPFCERFIAPASYFIASMLVADENEELSDMFFDRYSDSFSALISEIPGMPHPIKSVY